MLSCYYVNLLLFLIRCFLFLFLRVFIILPILIHKKWTIPNLYLLRLTGLIMVNSTFTRDPKWTKTGSESQTKPVWNPKQNRFGISNDFEKSLCLNNDFTAAIFQTIIRFYCTCVNWCKADNAVLVVFSITVVTLMILRNLISLRAFTVYMENSLRFEI